MLIYEIIIILLFKLRVSTVEVYKVGKFTLTVITGLIITLD